MKGFTVVLLAVLGVTSALPNNVELRTDVESRQTRFVGDLIATIIEDLSLQMRENGLDPFNYEGASFSYALPVPVLLSADAHAADISVVGASEILIHNMNYGILSGRLQMDISLPRIDISLADAGFDVTVLGSRFAGSVSNARLSVVNARVAGEVVMNTGIITGIWVREVDLDFTLGALEFSGSVNLLGQDVTAEITDFVTNAIPARINELKSEINELVNMVVKDLVDGILA